MLRAFVVFVLMVAASPVFAADKAPKTSPTPTATPPQPPAAYLTIKEKSSLKFIATLNGAPVEGQFKDFSTDIVFDENQLDKSHIKVEVNTASVVAANDELASNVKLPDWLSVDKFAKASFVSKKINRMPSTNSYYADGELTIRGQKKPATLNFELDYPTGGRAIATGFVTLLRKDFGVGQGQWQDEGSVKNIVRVEFRIVADKK
ncbi:MAG: YceI family protein [Alphaproteobacteria bacterium]|nr:YceI family protein [Alphaproteobacteria bacterium]